MKTKYEKDVEEIQIQCCEIEWEADNIPDIFFANDFVDIPDGFIEKITALNEAIEALRLSLEP